MSRLNEIRARLAAATQYPWTVEGAQHNYLIQGPGPRENGWSTGPIVLSVDTRKESQLSRLDADLISNAPSDLEWLIYQVEELQGEIELDRVIADERSESYDMAMLFVEYERDEAVEMLQKLEWADGGWCAVCMRSTAEGGHTQDCELKQLLGRLGRSDE